MKKKLPADWVRTIKKHVDRLKAANSFGDYLKLNLGHPEPLKGNGIGKYSVRISGNVRLIIKPDETNGALMICEVIEMEGIVDYHGGKENWYIS